MDKAAMSGARTVAIVVMLVATGCDSQKPVAEIPPPGASEPAPISAPRRLGPPPPRRGGNQPGLSPAQQERVAKTLDRLRAQRAELEKSAPPTPPGSPCEAGQPGWHYSGARVVNGKCLIGPCKCLRDDGKGESMPPNAEPSNGKPLPR